MLTPNTNIYSKAFCYEARALTNPTELSRYYQSLRLPFPLYDKECNNLYADVDTAYFKVIKPFLINNNLLRSKQTINLMAKLIARKLGFDYLFQSFYSNDKSLYFILKEYHKKFDLLSLRHTIGFKKGFWYSNSGSDNAFIKSLTRAYQLLEENLDHYIPNSIPRGKIIIIHFPVTKVNSLYENHPVNKATKQEYKGNLNGFCELLKVIDPKSFIIFGDNILQKGNKGQASIRESSNSFGIPTKWYPSYKYDAFFKDEDVELIKEKLNPIFDTLENYLNQGYNLYFPNTGIGTGLSLEKNPYPTSKVSEYFIQRLTNLGLNLKEVSPPFVKENSPFLIPKDHHTQIAIIISGGQTGADIGGLKGARKRGIKTTGFAPYNFLTEKGKQKELLLSFNLIEDTSPKVSDKFFNSKTEFIKFCYISRTKLNVIHSDGTIIFGDVVSKGTELTIKLCKEHSKPYIVNPSSDQFKFWLILNAIKVLNVAGNRESVSPHIETEVHNFIFLNII